MLAEIGRILALWSYVEQQFDLLVLSEVAFEGVSSGKIDDRIAKVMKQPIATKMKDIRKVLSRGNSKRGLSVSMVEATFQRMLTLKDVRDMLAHGRLNFSISSDNLIAPDRLAVLHMRFDSPKNILNPVSVEIDLESLRKTSADLDLLYWEFFDLSMGTKPFEKGSASSGVRGSRLTPAIS
ncbi:hypothetical protein [Mesorhizobium sophorae]|uniref:hypothetical protein n=1 Tax=Mesorhizobium sophorae TaxID=1300294 RepID=UPI00197D0114|nr:hypothetical protein [Mesorhizobium sophorae]